MRTLFFFLHDLDEDYEKQSGPVRGIVDEWFARRLSSTHDLQAAGILPLLQAKTVIWFLFPVLSALRDHALPSEPPQRRDVTISPRNAEPATVDVQLRIMRNTSAHMLEEKPGAIRIDLDTWTFNARNGTVSFGTSKGCVTCLSDLLNHATAQSTVRAQDRAGRFVRSNTSTAAMDDGLRLASSARQECWISRKGALAGAPPAAPVRPKRQYRRRVADSSLPQSERRLLRPDDARPSAVCVTPDPLMSRKVTFTANRWCRRTSLTPKASSATDTVCFVGSVQV
jgi:hypothetical protein